jgi:hypothetical protein
VLLFATCCSSLQLQYTVLWRTAFVCLRAHSLARLQLLVFGVLAVAAVALRPSRSKFQQAHSTAMCWPFVVSFQAANDQTGLTVCMPPCVPTHALHATPRAPAARLSPCMQQMIQPYMVDWFQTPVFIHVELIPCLHCALDGWAVRSLLADCAQSHGQDTDSQSHGLNVFVYSHMNRESVTAMLTLPVQSPTNPTESLVHTSSNIAIASNILTNFPAETQPRRFPLKNTARVPQFKHMSAHGKAGVQFLPHPYPNLNAVLTQHGHNVVC